MHFARAVLARTRLKYIFQPNLRFAIYVAAFHRNVHDRTHGLKKRRFLWIISWRFPVDSCDQVTGYESSSFAGASWQNGHDHLTLLRWVNNPSAVEDSRFSPVDVFVKVEVAPQAIEGDIELPRDASTDIA